MPLPCPRTVALATHCTRTSKLGIPDFVGNRVANSGRQVVRDGGVLNRPSPINPGLLFRTTLSRSGRCTRSIEFCIRGGLECDLARRRRGFLLTGPIPNAALAARPAPPPARLQDICCGRPGSLCVHAGVHTNKYHRSPRHKMHIIGICVLATLISKKNTPRPPMPAWLGLVVITAFHRCGPEFVSSGSLPRGIISRTRGASAPGFSAGCAWKVATRIWPRPWLARWGLVGPLRLAANTWVSGGAQGRESALPSTLVRSIFRTEHKKEHSGEWGVGPLWIGAPTGNYSAGQLKPYPLAPPGRP